MAKSIILFVLCQLIVSSLNDIIQPQNIPVDPCLGCQYFPETDSDNGYSHFSIIMLLNETTVLISARNSLLFMSYNGQYKDSVDLKDPSKCFLENPEDCYSTVDFMIEDEKELKLCGNVALQRTCWAINNKKVTSTWFGYYPQGQFAYLNTDEFLYTAFANQNGNGKLSKQNLKNPIEKFYKLFIYPTYPEFVSIYVFGNYVYYFFREQQEEVQDPDKIVYSRVARLCKYDTGGPLPSPAKSQLTLFSKARLLCEKPLTKTGFKQRMVHYNHLEKTSYVKSKDGKIHIYGLFKSSNPYVGFSVICRFSLDDIDKVFESRQYYKMQNSVLIKSTLSNNDARLTQHCNGSLDTTKLSYDSLTLTAASSLAFQAVKPEGGKPVLEVENCRISHIAAKSVDTSVGEDSYHILHMIDSNKLLNAAVPAKLGQVKSNIYSKQIISQDELEVLDFKQIQNNLFVGSASKMVVIPDNVCKVYKTCRECVHSRNPHCGWHEITESCQTYNHSARSFFKQDVKNGNFSAFCKRENASCVLTLNGQPSKNQELTLHLTMSGVPTTKLLSMKHKGSEVDLATSDIVVTKSSDRVDIMFKKFDLSLAGEYKGHVGNLWSKGLCSIIVPGSQPKLKCYAVYKKSWFVNCSVTGYPQPSIKFNVVNSSGDFKTESSGVIKVKSNHSYQGFGENEFGADVGKKFKLHSKHVEFGLNRTWQDSLGDVSSGEYQKVKSDVIEQLRSLYPADMPMLVKDLKLRQGSCIVSLTMSSVTSSESPLEGPLENAIKNGKLGNMAVYEYEDVKIIPTEDRPSSEPPSTVHSTQPPSSPIVPSGHPLSTTFPPSTDYRPTNTSIIDQGTVSPGIGDRGGSGETVSSATFIAVVIILICIISVLLVIIAYICGVDLYFCKKLDRKRSESGSCDQDEEMEGLPRNKVRESRRKLLHKHDEKKASPKKSPDNSQRNAGSVEIKQEHNQSVC